MYWSSHGSFALLSVKSRKQRGVLWFLRGSMPSWQLQADWADMCPKGMCSPTSSCGRITRDLRSCYNIFLYSFLLFIYMLKKDWLEELHPWCHMNKWIVVQKMVGKKMMVLLLGNSTILMSGQQWECQWQNHKTSSSSTLKWNFILKRKHILFFCCQNKYIPPTILLSSCWIASSTTHSTFC